MPTVTQSSVGCVARLSYRVLFKTLVLVLMMADMVEDQLDWVLNPIACISKSGAGCRTCLSLWRGIFQFL